MTDERYLRGYLKVKVHWNLNDGSIKVFTEEKKEYNFTDIDEANWYFKGLGYLDMRITEMFLKIPEIEKELHFKERHDPRGIGIDGFILENVTPISKAEYEVIRKIAKNRKLKFLQMWIDQSQINYVV